MKRPLTAALVALVALVALPVDATQLRYPSTCHSGCMIVTAYRDTGGTKDWSCGTTTYSGHKGTDFAILGRFTAQDQGRDIVAAADGDVTYTHDGEFDRCESGTCAGGSGFGNWVKLKHADGKETIYGHMRNGTVAVAVGQKVTCGQKLGQVGSSGYSTGPHLHFEPRVSGVADDPFGQGACSGPEIFWVDQGAYRALPAQTCEVVGPPPPPPNQAPRGNFDSADCVNLRGWSQDQDDAAKPVQVELWIDGDVGSTSAKKITVTADLKRDDLCAPLGSCEHAFEVPLPSELRDGKPHEIIAYGLDLAGGPSTKLAGSPRTITCAAPSEPKPDAGALDAGAVDAPDASAPSRDAATASDSALGPASDLDEPTDDGTIEGSCGCHTAGARSKPPLVPAGLALLVLALFSARRRPCGPRPARSPAAR